MKVKAIIEFNDLQDKVKRIPGEIFECTKERANFLLEKKAIEIIEEIKEEFNTNDLLEDPYKNYGEEKPKKSNKKKNKK